jgi:hypothetical protein
VEAQLQKLKRKLPELPCMADISQRARAELEKLQNLYTEAPIEQIRALVGMYVKMIKADPDAHSVEISLYPAPFSQIIAVGGFDLSNSLTMSTFRGGQPAELVR